MKNNLTNTNLGNTPYDKNSSLKNFKFDGWTNERIIEKYETVLASRENQITDLSIEIGTLNDRTSEMAEKYIKILQENEMLKNRIQKKDNLIAQEMSNKEIMFMRMEKKEQECDELSKKLEGLLKKERVVEKELPKFENYSEQAKSKTLVDLKPISNEVKSISTETKSHVESDSAPMTKSSAKDRIRELKAKVGSTNKINFTGMQEKTDKNEKEVIEKVEDNYTDL